MFIFIFNLFICYPIVKVNLLFVTHTFVNLGDSEIASQVNDESEAEGEEARKFLEDVRVTFPEVCVLKHTRHNLIFNYVSFFLELINQPLPSTLYTRF